LLPEISDYSSKNFIRVKTPRSSGQKKNSMTVQTNKFFERTESEDLALKEYDYELLKKNIRLGIYFSGGSSGAYLNLFSKLNDLDASEFRLSRETYFTERENMYMQSKLMDSNMINQSNFIGNRNI
jgi:hypothetical protein